MCVLRGKFRTRLLFLSFRLTCGPLFPFIWNSEFLSYERKYKPDTGSPSSVFTVRVFFTANVRGFSTFNFQNRWIKNKVKDFENDFFERNPVKKTPWASCVLSSLHSSFYLRYKFLRVSRYVFYCIERLGYSWFVFGYQPEHYLWRKNTNIRSKVKRVAQNRDPFLLA